MRKVHSQWKMSRIGGFRRKNLRHKYVLSLLVKTIILKSHTIFFSIPLFQIWTTIRTWSSINIFSLLLNNFRFYLMIFVSEELEKKRQQFNFREKGRRFDIRSVWELQLISLFYVPALIFIDITWVRWWSTEARSATWYHWSERDVSTSVLIMKYCFNDTDFNDWTTRNKNDDLRS